MRDPFFIDEQACISFSGGRTSAYMLYRILSAHGGKLPDYVRVVFANTGREMPETLDFVEACGREWNVSIDWVERYCSLNPAREEPKQNRYLWETVKVDHQSAARDGEPFEALNSIKTILPNPVARFCTVELKIRAISEWLTKHCGFEKPYIGLIGIRADETRRAVKIRGTIESGQERVLPLYDGGVRVADIGAFWAGNSFDLALPNNGGVTDWGNCDLCFLKGGRKKMSIIQQRPDLADWWIKQEGEMSGRVGKGAFFRNDQPSYATMKAQAQGQGQLFDVPDDDSIPCFCGD